MAKDPERARAMQTWAQSVAPAIARLRADPDLEGFFQEFDQDGMGALAKYEQYDWFLQKLSAAQASVSYVPEEGGSGSELTHVGPEKGGDWLARELSAAAQAGASSEESIEERAMRELEDELIEEVFAEFDRDKDKVLSLDEFNALQRATEGPDAAFSPEQLLSLLQDVSPELQEPERGMPFAVFYRLYSDDELVDKYNTDIVQDHGVIFGSSDVQAMPSKEVPEALFGDRAVD